MKKLINLVPPSVKHERNMKKAQKSVVYLVIACAGSVGAFNQYEKHVQKQIDELTAQISDYTAKEGEVDRLGKEIEQTIEQKESISSSSFPYHRFLYFITVNATDDMRILSVESISPNIKEETAQTEGTQEANGTSTTEGEASTETQEPQTESPPAEELNSPVPGEQPATPEGTPAGGAIDPETGKPITTEKKPEESPFSFETSEIYIRGYSVYPDSIAILANKIKKEEYIETVTVTKIRDYYTGMQNFKLFEMKITYQ